MPASRSLPSKIDNLVDKEKFLLLDFETNTQDAGDVIEVAAYKLAHDKNEYKIIDIFHRYYFSRYPVNKWAFAVHWLNPERIRTLRDNEAYEKHFDNDVDFLNFCNDTTTLIAHNTSFELRHINNRVRFKNTFCTMRENKHIVQATNAKGKIKNPTLKETLNYYEIHYTEGKLHGALYDIEKTLEILNSMNRKDNNYHVLKEILKNKAKNNDLKQIGKMNSRKGNVVKIGRKENYSENIVCPKCSSTKNHKKDKRKRKTYTVQRYQCVDCKHVFQKKISENTDRHLEVFSLNGVIPTSEQQRIILALLEHELIKINAFAGTGKTLTLQMLTKYYFDKSFLYLAYNKSVQMEAKNKFGRNVNVQTLHALAYRYVHEFSTLNLKSIVNYSVRNISELLGIDYKTAKNVLIAFNTYCQSKHLDIFQIEEVYLDKKAIIVGDPIKNYIYKLIEGIENQKINVSFDYVLKKFHLLLEAGIEVSSYDVIMLDEAQDSNDVALAVIEFLDAKHKLFVGDKHQQIYGFNGSSNVMNKIECIEFSLTKTFRLPEDITKHANHILRHFKNEPYQILSEKPHYDFDKICNDPNKNIAYISRGNARLLVTMKELSSQREKYKTIRHPKEIFLTLKDIAYYFNDMKENISFKNSFLKYMKGEDELISYFVQVEDMQLEMYYRIYKLVFSESIDEIESLEQEAILLFTSNEKIKIILTTAHSAKGLEFDAVVIEDDFREFPAIICDLGYNAYQDFKNDISNTYYNNLVEEFNIFYVAITRAKYAIKIKSVNIEFMMPEWLDRLNEILFQTSYNPLNSCYSKENENKRRKTMHESFAFSGAKNETSTERKIFSDAFSVLGLSVDASITDVKIKYRKLMMKYHPDKTKDKKEEYTKKAQEFNSAYDDLMKMLNDNLD